MGKGETPRSWKGDIDSYAISCSTRFLTAIVIIPYVLGGDGVALLASLIPSHPSRGLVVFVVIAIILRNQLLLPLSSITIFDAYLPVIEQTRVQSLRGELRASTFRLSILDEDRSYARMDI